MLAVTNFQTLSNAFAGKNGIIANYEMFRQDPSLEAWISKTEALWITDGIQFEKIDELPNATIYVVRPAPDQIHLIAYVVSQDKPIGVILYGFGTFDDLALLNNTGVMADFKTMVTSVTAHKSSLVPDVPEMNADLLTISPKSGPFNNDSGYHYVGVYTYRLRTNYYQAPPIVYWLYEYMYYGGPPEHDTWLYRTNITDDPPCACAYGASCSLYQHSIGKMASRETHIATDSYTANKVVDHLGTNTAHMMVFGDPYARICMWYKPFTHQ